MQEWMDGSVSGGRTASMMVLVLLPLPRNKEHVLCVSGVLLPHIT